MNIGQASEFKKGPLSELLFVTNKTTVSAIFNVKNDVATLWLIYMQNIGP